MWLLTEEGRREGAYAVKDAAGEKGLYMFEEEDGSKWIDLNASYYGEVTYQMQYKSYTTDKFSWLFVDFKTLKAKALEVGFKTDLVFKGASNDYLAKLYL